LALVAIPAVSGLGANAPLIGKFVCESGKERNDVAIYITVSAEPDGKLSLALTAAHPDGHGAAPDGDGEGRVDADGIFRFTYEDSFLNKGEGTFRRVKGGYLLSIHIQDVQDSRCLPFYGEHLFQRRSHDKGLTMRCSEPQAVLMPSFESMRTSLLIRAVADLVSR
jgi:hypothetical protein